MENNKWQKHFLIFKFYTISINQLLKLQEQICLVLQVTSTAVVPEQKIKLGQQLVQLFHHCHEGIIELHDPAQRPVLFTHHHSKAAQKLLKILTDFLSIENSLNVPYWVKVIILLSKITPKNNNLLTIITHMEL